MFDKLRCLSREPVLAGGHGRARARSILRHSDAVGSQLVVKGCKELCLSKTSGKKEIIGDLRFDIYQVDLKSFDTYQFSNLKSYMTNDLRSASASCF